MTKQDSIIEYCQKRVRKRLRMSIDPEVTVNIREFEGPDHRGQYRIKSNLCRAVQEPSEFLCEEGYFNRVKGMLREEYPQLWRDTERNVPLTVFLIETIIFIGSTHARISGSFNWLAMGMLKNGEKYCAVLDVEVRPLLRRCGLMNLMKHAEIALARREQCDFIQTWHTKDNPNFNAAIVPSLKRGFILYHGDEDDRKEYEQSGSVHLRYYFDRGTRRNVRVQLKYGKEFMSPAENSAIAFYLESCPDIYAGKTIRNIQPYGQESARTRIRAKREIINIEKVKVKSYKERIFFSEGAATSELECYRHRNTYRIGDSLTFFPYVELDHYVKSDRDVPYMKHIIYNIYEFSFKPESELFFEWGCQDGIPDPEFIINLISGFRVRYREHPRARKEMGGLKVGQWYEGYGRLTIGDHRHSVDYKIPSFIKDITITGKLVSILKDAIRMDYCIKYVHRVKKFRWGIKDVYGVEDALDWFGYYRDLKEFKKKVAKYIKNPVEYESTDLPEPPSWEPQLFFGIELNSCRYSAASSVEKLKGD